MTQDLLSHGERRRGARDRPAWWYVVIAVPLAVAILVSLLSGRTDQDRSGPAAIRSPGPSSPLVAGELDRPTDSRLFAAGDGLLQLDVDGTSARSLAVPGLLPGRHVGSLTSRRGATVVLVSPDRSDGPSGKAWAVPEGGSAPVALGEAQQVLPATAPDRIWLVTGGTARGGGRLLLRQLDVHGRLVTPAYAIRLAGRLVADVDGGFLVERQVGGVATLEIVDRRTVRVQAPVARRATALAVGPHQLAWFDPSCRLRCLVYVKDLRSGERVVVSILDVATYGAAMTSPDASRLAFTARAVVTPGGRPEPVLLVAGIAEPGLSVVRLPESAVSDQPAGTYLPQALTWSANGQWVFLATPGPAQRLLAWRLESAAVAAVHLPIAGVTMVAPV